MAPRSNVNNATVVIDFAEITWKTGPLFLRKNVVSIS